MSRRQNALAALYDELRTIEVFDRVREFSTNTDLADNQAYEKRQKRRAQITAEIQKLKETKPIKRPLISSVLHIIDVTLSHYGRADESAQRTSQVTSQSGLVAAPAGTDTVATAKFLHRAA